MEKNRNTEESVERRETDLNKMTPLQIITRCGSYATKLTQVIALLRPRLSNDEILRVTLAMRTPGSDEYNAYETGMTTADFKLHLSYWNEPEWIKIPTRHLQQNNVGRQLMPHYKINSGYLNRKPDIRFCTRHEKVAGFFVLQLLFSWKYIGLNV